MYWTQRWIFPPHKRSYCVGLLYAPSSFFWCNICNFIVHWFVFFMCQTYAVIILELFLFETGKDYFQYIVQLVIFLFAAEFILFVVVCISFLWCSFLEAPICTTIFMTVKHVFKRDLNFLTQIFDFFPCYFLSCTPYLSLVGDHLFLVHPHRWSLISLTMQNMWLATTFTWWDVYAGKDGSGIYS